MQTLMEVVSHYSQNPRLAAGFLDATVKSTVILALAGAVCLIWRRASAATRHLIWFLAVVSLPFLPWLSTRLPSWQSSAWVVSTSIESGNQVSLAFEKAATAQQGLTTTRLPAVSSTSGAAPPHEAHAGVPRNRAVHFNTLWLNAALLVYGAGVFLVIGRLLIGQAGLYFVRHAGHPPKDAEWTALLGDSCVTLRIGRSVRLLQSAKEVMPATWGWWRPVILLPAQADDWTSARRRVVLLHELAHVKRWDCLTQFATGLVCTAGWFNPLIWLAARRMAVERERACDDLVLNGGVERLDYAGHLVDLARSLRGTPHVAAIAMASSAPLEGRIKALVDATRARRLSPATMLGVLLIAGGTVLGVSACRTNGAGVVNDDSQKLHQQHLARLKDFSVLKVKQSEDLAAKAGEKILPPYRILFDAAVKGDWRTVTNQYAYFKQHHPQYVKGDAKPDYDLRTSYWQPALEISLAYFDFADADPKYLQLAIDGLMNPVPAGSIYFGGTDPGRGQPTAFSQDQTKASPYFTLTQNALVDGSYLEYLREMYGAKIYIPSPKDSQQCFEDYLSDASRRLDHDTRFPNEPKQLKPGENIHQEQDRVLVNGQVAVMSINALLTKVIFDHNPSNEFYVEESFPLEWMRPYLSPDGLIMKVNREPITELSDMVIRKDNDYWNGLVQPMIGNWLKYDTSVQDVVSFVDRSYVRHDLTGFTGDPRFVRSEFAQVFFGKKRGSIAGAYAWRLDVPGRSYTNNGVLILEMPYGSKKSIISEAERARMVGEADFAFRQAFALCPYSPDVVPRYVTFLTAQKRPEDARLVVQAALRAQNTLHPKDDPQGTKAIFEELLKQLESDK